MAENRGEGSETRVVDGLLEIKALSAMLGYINFPSPFTADGWFATGDRVEQDGEYIRILGRESEIINVGGEKVFPAEVESVLLQLNFIAEATVFGEKNAIIGSIVCAKIRLKENEAKPCQILRNAIKYHCNQVLAPYKVPVKIIFDQSEQFNDRYKKKRV